MFKSISLFISAMLVGVLTFASVDAYVLTGNEASDLAPNANKVRMKNFTSVPNYIQFVQGKELPLEKLEVWLRRYYQTDDNYGLTLLSIEEDELGFKHYRYQQTINGIPVKLGMYIAHTKNGMIHSLNGELFDNINAVSNANIAESTALFKALNHIGADLYKWEIPEAEAHLKWEQNDPNATYYPQGELTYINDGAIPNNELRLTYMFNVYAQTPLSRKEIYVDAQTGAIVWEENKLHDADVVGTAATGYSGTKTMTSDFTGTNYRLRESGRGNGIRTFNCNNTTTYSNTDFTNPTANWTTFNPAVDVYATDAHWGAEMTYDYFFLEHGRNSIDNNGFQLNSYVHYDNNFFNAFWDGQRMTYGDGNNNATPLTAIDIAGHEITHGLTNFTANLVYQAESGALNESFSDIFGNSIERYARPTQNSWQMGEDLGIVIRNMQNPKAEGDPDTYFGQNWASLTGGDNGGVHTNSGVQNYWYYLLTMGGSGTNDNNDNYNVTGLGLVKAGKIAFRNLVVYLTTSSQYADARFYSIQSATDLYGGCSPEVASTTNAWYAVGVGGPYQPFTVSDFNASITTSCVAPFTVTFNNTSVNGTTFQWNFGDGNTSTQLSPTHTYTANGTYNVTLIADGGASCGKDTVVKNAYITIDPNLPCIVTMPANGSATTQTACSGTIFDSGGPNGDYGANENSVITISPIGAADVTLNFISFDIEAGQNNSCNWDDLKVYDGNSTAATLIGTYCNNNIPTTITSTGGSITIEFSSDQAVEEAGFEIDWSCNLSNVAPVANFDANVDSTCTGEVQFTDLSTNGPTSWFWDFGDGNNSSLQHPTHTYAASGTYTVQLTATNAIGNHVETKTNYINVNMPTNPTVTGDVVCENNIANLSASGNGTLNWYNVATGGTIINTGNNFTTPVLTSSTTYYVEDVIASPTLSMGKPNNSGSGANFNNQQHLLFDVYAPMEIIEVDVYSGASGNRTIELRNSSNVLLQSTTVNIPTGQHTVQLNFTVTPGTDYQLRLANGSNIDLYRNDGSVNYPYTLNGMGSITRSTAGTNGGLSHYYFFYNWKVKAPDCISGREAVTATVNNCTDVDELNQNQGVYSYFNHLINNLQLKMTGLAVGKYNVTITNALGQTITEEAVNITNDVQQHQINLEKASKGIYFVTIYNDAFNYTSKFVKP